MKKNGFTLIETIIYLALFAILMAGILTSVYSLIQASGRNQTKAMIQEEGVYLSGKIDWALTGAQNITQPTGTGTTLSLTKFGGSMITIDLSGANIRLARGAGSPQVLNNTNISVTALEFIHTNASGEISPESLETKFTLSAKTPDGIDISQNFSTIKYLRK